MWIEQINDRRGPLWSGGGTRGNLHGGKRSPWALCIETCTRWNPSKNRSTCLCFLWFPTRMPFLPRLCLALLDDLSDDVIDEGSILCCPQLLEHKVQFISGATHQFTGVISGLGLFIQVLILLPVVQNHLWPWRNRRAVVQWRHRDDVNCVLKKKWSFRSPCILESLDCILFF